MDNIDLRGYGSRLGMSESKGEELCRRHTNTSQETGPEKQPFFNSVPSAMLHACGPPRYADYKLITKVQSRRRSKTWSLPKRKGMSLNPWAEGGGWE